MASQNGVTPADAWGPPAEVVELPSGKTAKLKPKLNVWTLVRRGTFTPELVEAYAKAERGELDDLGQAVELNDAIVQEMFVQPRVFVPSDEDTDVPEGQVHVDDLDDDDLTFVLERAFQGGREAAGFRGERDGADDSGDGEVLGNDPVGDGGVGGGEPAGVPVGPKVGGKARGAGAKRKPKPRAKAAK
jgi:hypothetical protein